MGRLGRVFAVAALGLGLTACATFPDNGPRDWHDKIENVGELGGPPSIAESPPPSAGQAPPSGASGRSGAPPPPTPCVDPDPQVVATCLAPVGAITVLPGGESALVAERTTGRVLRIEKGKDPQLVATLTVDATGGGGVTGLVTSPAYVEDQLLYAYITTPTDNRVVRIAPGEPEKPILAGIPRGATHNRGALAVDVDGSLLVATGDTGAPPAPASLAGKVLRIDTLGRPGAHNPDPASPVLGSGLQDPGGMCVDLQRGAAWVTDHTPEADVLALVTVGAPVTTGWRWPDKPGVAGCHAADGGLVVARTDAKSAFLLSYTGNAQFTGTPETALQDKYGRLAAVAGGPDGSTWIGTVNKAGGSPTPTDDRVIRVQLAPSGGAGKQ